MNRRQYIQSVGGIALTPALSITGKTDSEPEIDTNPLSLQPLDETHLTPEQYKRWIPSRIQGRDELLEASVFS